MTNLEWIIKQKPKRMLLDTIDKLIHSCEANEFCEAEEQAMAMKWLFSERREDIIVELSENPGIDLAGHNAIMPES